MAHKSTLQPSTCQIICTNRKCYTGFIIGYIITFVLFYVSTITDLLYPTIIGCILLLLTAIIGIKYRDTHKPTYKSYALWIVLLFVLICEICVLIYYLRPINQYTLIIIIITYTLSFICGLYGIYHAKIVIVNLQPNLQTITSNTSNNAYKNVTVVEIEDV
eukprot:116320_1